MPASSSRPPRTSSIQSRSARVGTAAFDAAIADVVARVSKVADVQNVRSPLAPGNADQISKDGHSALVQFEIRGDKDKAVDKIAPVLDGVAAAQRAHPGFVIGEFGDASAQKGVETAYVDDLGKAGMLSLPITLIVLVLAFGALVAAGIPLLLALTAVFATFGLIALPSACAAGRDGGPRDGAPDRARGRRRLLDVLLEARAAGAGRRKQRAGGAGSRRRDLRPLGADLGADGDGRDGRHVPDRRQDLLLPRCRDDPRGRRRSARVADRASRSALAARRQGRPGARPARRPPQPRRRRRADLGRDRRPRPAPAGALGSPRRHAAAGARRARAAAAPRGSGARVVPEVARGHQDVRPDAAGVSRHGASGERRREGTGRERTGGA